MSIKKRKRKPIISMNTKFTPDLTAGKWMSELQQILRVHRRKVLLLLAFFLPKQYCNRGISCSKHIWGTRMLHLLIPFYESNSTRFYRVSLWIYWHKLTMMHFETISYWRKYELPTKTIHLTGHLGQLFGLIAKGSTIKIQTSTKLSMLCKLSIRAAIQT